MWQRHGDRMRAALERHDQLVKGRVEAEDGYVSAGGGDGLGVVFSNPKAAVAAAISIQDALSDLTVGEDPLAVRMSIHTGAAQAGTTTPPPRVALTDTDHRLVEISMTHPHWPPTTEDDDGERHPVAPNWGTPRHQ